MECATERRGDSDGPHIMAMGTESVVATAGERLALQCAVVKGGLPLTLTWLKESVPAANLAGLSVKLINDFTVSLTVESLSWQHAGRYTCWAQNEGGRAEASVTVVVQVPPTWTSQPSDVQTVSGHSVELHCQVQGVPEPQVTWYFSKDKGSDKYSALFNNNRTLIGNQSLMISPVEASDQGYYQCEASNGVGSNINADVTLQVQLPPEVHLNDDYLAVRRGSGTVLRCTVRGDLPLSIQWRKDGNPIDPSVQPRMLSQSNSASGASGGHGGGGGGGVMFSEFSIANSASSDEALYECTAANIHGEDSDTVFVQVQDVPHPPQELRIKEVASRQVTVEWKAPADGGNPLQEYIIFYKPLLNINEGTMRQERVPASQTSASVKNLQPATTYQLHLAAANSLGQGQPSATLTVTSDEEVPEGPPLNVMASSVTSRDLLVVWSPPMAVLQNGVLSGYFVSVREMGDETGKTLNRTLVSPPSGSSHGEFRLTRLRPNTNYIVYVQAVNSKGTGPPSPGLSIRTLEDVPEEAPGNVACVALNSQSLQITWQPPGAERRNGVLRGYRVFFDRADRDLTALDREAAASKTTTELTLLLSGLQKFSNYSVQVLAFTAVGDGMRSAPLTCTTEEDVPEMPAQVKVMLSSSDSIIVSWLPSQRPNGRITHYAIYSKEIERGQDTNSQKWTVADHVTRSEIRNLRRRAVYYFQVAAATRAGEGPKSPTVSFNYSPSNKIPAAIVSIGSDYTVARWSRMILPCMPVGDPPLQVAWFEEGRQIQDWLTLSGIKSHGDQWRAFIGDQDQDGESVVQVFTNGSLHVSRLAENAGGNYTCKVRNRHGEDSVSYPISVVVPPPAPILRFAASNWSSVTLQWSVSSSFQQLIGRTEKSNKMSPESKRSRVSPVRGFIFRHRPRISESGWTEFSVGPSLRSVTVQELSCGTEYEFLLVASSRIGNSSISNVVSAKTKGSPPEYLPTEESELAVTATSCTVYMSNWQDRGCPIQQFIFRFRTADSSDWIIAGAESPPQQAFLLGGLQPSTAYVIRVTATNVAGSTSREYAIETESPVDDFTWRNRGEEHSGLAPLFADPRVAVPIAISALAIFLTAITLLLRFRYRSQYIRPPSQAPDPSSHIRPYADESTDDACSLSVAKRVASMDNCSSDYGDDVSPYAVFPMPHTKASYSSTRRMKTFVVEKHDPVEMSNYAPNRGLADPNYDYIAPCGADVGDFRPRRVMVPKINPHSVFVPIPARSHPHQPQLHHQPGSGTSTFHRMSTWNNQETLALTQRL